MQDFRFKIATNGKRDMVGQRKLSGKGQPVEFSEGFGERMGVAIEVTPN